MMSDEGRGSRESPRFSQENVCQVRSMPASRIAELSRALGLPRRTLFAFLGISRTSVNHRLQARLPLPVDESQHVQGIESLVGQVQAMVEESVHGEAAGFDSARWFGHWLRQPLPALGGRLPASYLHTLEGQKLVGKIPVMISSGSYA